MVTMQGNSIILAWLIYTLGDPDQAIQPEWICLIHSDGKNSGVPVGLALRRQQDGSLVAEAECSSYPFGPKTPPCDVANFVHSLPKDSFGAFICERFGGARIRFLDTVSFLRRIKTSLPALEILFDEDKFTLLQLSDNIEILIHNTSKQLTGMFLPKSASLRLYHAVFEPQGAFNTLLLKEHTESNEQAFFIGKSSISDHIRMLGVFPASLEAACQTQPAKDMSVQVAPRTGHRTETHWFLSPAGDVREYEIQTPDGVDFDVSLLSEEELKKLVSLQTGESTQILVPPRKRSVFRF